MCGFLEGIVPFLDVIIRWELGEPPCEPQGGSPFSQRKGQTFSKCELFPTKTLAHLRGTCVGPDSEEERLLIIERTVMKRREEKRRFCRKLSQTRKIRQTNYLIKFFCFFCFFQKKKKTSDEFFGRKFRIFLTRVFNYLHDSNSTFLLPLRQSLLTHGLNKQNSEVGKSDSRVKPPILRNAMLRIGEVEEAESIDELITSVSIEERRIPDFKNLDFKIASGHGKILTRNFKTQGTTA